MKKIIVAILAVVMLAAFGYGAGFAADQGKSDMSGARTGAAATDTKARSTAGTADRSWGEQHQVGKMIGKEVVNSTGDSLGSVKDFVVDDQGRINFAIVSHGGFLGMGGSEAVVPYEALSFDGKGHFALNMSKDQLAAAPRFDNNWTSFSDRSWTDQVYRYYGVQPRWSDTEFMGQPGSSSLHPGSASQPQGSSGMEGSGPSSSTGSNY